MEKKRAYVYDWVRLIATVLVVVGHSGYLNITTFLGGVNYSMPVNINPIYYSLPFNVWLSSTGWVYSFHMPLFFLLSGAVLALKKVPFTNFDDFVRTKIKRFIFPFLFTGIFYMIPVKMVGNFYLNRSLSEAICGFIQGTELGHLWFLPALFWCMFVFGTIYLILEKLNIKGIYVMWALSLVVQLTYSYLPFDILQLKPGLSYFFWFTSGYVFEKERQKIEYFDFRKLLFLTPVILWIEYHYLSLGTYSRIIFGSSLVFIIAVYCNKFLKRLVGTRLWHINVDNLFYIYLFHDPLEYIVLKIFMSTDYLYSSLGCIMYVCCRTLGVWIFSIVIAEITKFSIKRIRISLKNSEEKYIMQL